MSSLPYPEVVALLHVRC